MPLVEDINVHVSLVSPLYVVILVPLTWVLGPRDPSILYAGGLLTGIP